ncbi:uncharacterized protein T551_00159 [Pneumocystis jirovecii RU7]|uniref:Putative lipoate-protein ligase A n=1 Tax=Pneumocystis jirovecii (strain RU7) TaxID=1408657 RepID=A0A0W4ZWB6_PNEJ7|nr:uncharacterized protein T551_00159 [Pneumocystis jirovecii RU7]KTW32674.1 hypothetical protein T551_00159 [Pneumocystis jirovecii RU7]
MKSVIHSWKTPIVFISESHSPFVNLSFEDYLFRNHVSTVLLLLYRNDRSIIIGRNQNPWIEVDLKYMNERKITLVRRQSGGGAVFHDLGNTNYCLMTSRLSFDRKKTLQMVVDALHLAGRFVSMNKRYDLVFGSDMLKVSGSAFKISKDRAYQHGTMLLNTDLTSLKSLLTNLNLSIDAKGVQSISSAVGNLGLSHEDFCRHLCSIFQDKYNSGKPIPIHRVSYEDICSIDSVQDRILEMKHWSWVYGQTPEFTNRLAHTFTWGCVNVYIVCRRGLFFHIQVESNTELPFVFEEICHELIGRRYVADEIYSFLYTIETSPGIKKELIQFLEWLAVSI